jgi:hypothetical protein
MTKSKWDQVKSKVHLVDKRTTEDLHKSYRVRITKLYTKALCMGHETA